MTAALYFGAAVPLLERLFPPQPLLEKVQLTPYLILSVLQFSLAAAFLALWRAAPDYRVFRSLGIFYAIACAVQLVRYGGGMELYWTLIALAVAALVEAAGEAMRVPHRGWTRWFWPIYAFAGIAVWFPSISFLRDLSILSAVPLGSLIAQGLRHRNRRDRLIASAFSIYFLVRLTQYSVVQKLVGTSSYTTIGGWQWQDTSSTITLLGLATLLIFVRDLIHDRAEKQRLAAELAAGRAVQQVLIPNEFPSIQGFRVESVYRPFGDVGGDFFQILPLEHGGALVVIGDVSGKGMPAAMTVSLLVGALSLAVESSARPGEILAALNRALHGRNREGFTTCLAIRADADGMLTMANAGHIAPYLLGRELNLENGLPLGLTANAHFAESTFRLDAGQCLTLLTDGVVEARRKTGELFGFDRTASVASQSAESIAQAAQAFGQEDDITVLTLTRLKPGELSGTELAVPALAPT